MVALVGLLGLVSIGCFGVGFIGFIVRKLSKGSTKTPKRLVLLSVVIFVAATALGAATFDELDLPEEEETVVVESEPPVEEEVDKGEETTETPSASVEKPVEKPVEEPVVVSPEWWEGVVSEEVAGDIVAAFTEIGEDPAEIESIEYDSIRETALFDRRDYKVTFRMDSLKDKGWVHSRFYRLTTEEWHEGEPEREQYPREYLVTIKFWRDDNNTNVLQWSHTGNGELQ